MASKSFAIILMAFSSFQAFAGCELNLSPAGSENSPFLIEARTAREYFAYHSHRGIFMRSDANMLGAVSSDDIEAAPEVYRWAHTAGYRYAAPRHAEFPRRRITAIATGEAISGATFTAGPFRFGDFRSYRLTSFQSHRFSRLTVWLAAPGSNKVQPYVIRHQDLRSLRDAGNLLTTFLNYEAVEAWVNSMEEQGYRLFTVTGETGYDWFYNEYYRRHGRTPDHRAYDRYFGPLEIDWRALIR